MPPVELEARVRPSKVMLLLGDDAPMDSFLLCVKFLSRLWGGRYFPILPVPRAGVSETVVRQIHRDLPEFVFGVGVDDEAWRTAICDCPPIRGYGRLEREYVDRFFQEPTREDLVSFRPLIQEAMHTSGSQRRTILCASNIPASPFGPYLSVIYGEPGLQPRMAGHWPPYSTFTAERLTNSADLVHHWLDHTLNGVTWLDAVCGRLDLHISNGPLPSGPTIVLVQSPSDLALCWTLRRTADHDWPSWFIPIPAEEAVEPSTIEALALWSRESRRYPAWDHQITVTSFTANPTLAEAVVTALRLELGQKDIHARNGFDQLAELPTVVAAERPRVYSLSVENQTLSWQLPRPSWDRQEDGGTWVVDYLRDRRTSLALCELALPPRRACLDVLNAPAPTPHASYGWLERFGLSPEGMTARSHSRDEVVHQWLPTAEEVLTSLLLEGGIEPLQDEVRGLYLAAIELLGGLEHAAAACVGPARSALRVLENGPSTLDNLRCQTRLGNKPISSLQGRDPLAFHGQRFSPIQRRVGEARFSAHRNMTRPAEANLPGLLDYWSDHGIVHRTWQLPQCSTCRQTRWTDTLDVRQAPFCPVCGLDLRLPHQMQLGYSLNPLLRESLRQGLAPVALTARFLNWMTLEGFLWLPSQKVKWQGKDAEIDLMASADRRLVLAECKELDQAGPTSPSWPEVWEQFAQLVEIGVACRADLVVLAVLAEQFPDGWQESTERLANGRLRVLLLSRADLEAGKRVCPLPPVMASNPNIVGESRLHIRDLFE